ncbi:hypothetical protein ACFU53_09005 [Streptomyces sp. NPDC057474]|uniref:hypothetical protein n=1 Tax=Streptomyces sp. NPDC057474 TaxID=3346144 RepID=UPI0036D015A3
MSVERAAQGLGDLLLRHVRMEGAVADEQERTGPAGLNAELVADAVPVLVESHQGRAGRGPPGR